MVGVLAHGATFGEINWVFVFTQGRAESVVFDVIIEALVRDLKD